MVGQTMFSVLRGSEGLAEAALQSLSAAVTEAYGHESHRTLRSFGMSPLASALDTCGRGAALADVHYIFETEWETLDAHDDFYAGETVQAVYASLQPVFTSGPFEVLYDSLVEQPQHDNVAF